MRTLLLLILSLVIWVDATAQQKDSQLSESETVLIFTRHAEKVETDEPDPSLSEAGKNRAIKLLNLMRHYDTVDVIYSTDYRRTIETVQPTADHYELSINIYNPNELMDFKDQIFINHKGQTILIVGHSNTTPNLINLVMGEEKVGQFNESDYSNMYIIKMKEGEAAVLQHYIY